MLSGVEIFGGMAYDAAVKRSDGTGSGAVIPRDGDLIKVFQLCPAPVVLFGSGERPLRLMITRLRNQVQVRNRVLLSRHSVGVGRWGGSTSLRYKGRVCIS
jgi:hypothetical protein